ncbi:hypothetical protein QEN19_001050 [Hanseniaspora menglaensis]
MPKYLIHLAQCNFDFRRPELESLAELYNVEYLIPNGNNNVFTELDAFQTAPYLILNLENDFAAFNLVKRSILTMGIYELYGSGQDYDSIISQIASQKTENCSFKQFLGQKETVLKTMRFQLHTSGARSKYTMTEQIKKFNKFEALNIQNKISLKAPDIIYQLFENFDTPESELPSKVFFTRLVTLSLRSKNILDNLRLNKRPYIGTTTFEPELSLVTCNLALVKPYKLTYDPFCGTGGFLSTCATIEPKSMVIGSDLDGRMIRGGSSKSSTNSHITGRKNKNENEDLEKLVGKLEIQNKKVQGVRLNFKHYKQEEQLLGLMTMDFTHNSLRSSLKIDSIICDPPYGIREGIKVLGSKNGQEEKSKYAMRDGKLAYLADDYVAAKKQYSLDELMIDILKYADSRLPLNGRLAFWVPLANAKGIETFVMKKEGGLVLKYNCVQEFNNWARRLLVYVKTE